MSAQWEADVPVLRELYPALRRFAGVVTPVDVAPDDLVQEALTRVLARGGLQGIDDPLAYLRRAIVNVASNERRRSAIGRRALARQVTDAAAAPRADYPSDLDELRRLPARDRALLYLTEVEGAPIAEAAELVGCTEGAARMAVSRARRTLRKLLEDDDANTR
ncbi:MAG TPA: sigma-70 family RNA polymerase sigma factor [Acidimicrobiia bacterium]